MRGSLTDIIIVGAGHGGAQTAVALRQRGYAGSITVIGLEADLPYDRPSLSKDYLAGEKPFERILLRPASFWADRKVNFQLSSSVVGIHAERRRAFLSDGSVIDYKSLIWAAGGAPRQLSCPGAELNGIHVIRSRGDVDQLVGDLGDGTPHVLIVGGGYVGLEAAAVLIKRGCRVTLLEALPRVLARVAGEELSHFYEEEHRTHGVDLRLGTTVRQIEGDGRRVTGVTLASGEEIACDAIVVGIGIIPSIVPLEAAGAICGNGVLVDEYCRTSLPDVFAIGDCAAYSSKFADGAVIRLESVQNATDMANVVAKYLCGQPSPFCATPWFWSNQYDLRLQTVGLSVAYERAVVRGDMKARSFSIIYLRAGRVIALDCVNATKDYVTGRKLVEAGAMIEVERLRDSDRPLNLLTVSSDER